MHIQKTIIVHRENRLLQFASSSKDRLGAYENAINESNTKKGINPQSVDTELDMSLDRILRETHIGFPEWTKWLGLRTKARNAREAMHAEARRRIEKQCPELDEGWFTWVFSSATRRAYWTAENKIVQSLAQETVERMNEIDQEISDLDGRYEDRQMAKFKRGRVKITRKASRAKTQVLSAIGSAAKKTAESYKNYKDFPPDIKRAMETEERLVDDLVSKYEIIKPEEVESLFQKNQNGESLLLDRVDQYFKGKLFMSNRSSGARLLQKHGNAPGGAQKVEAIHGLLRSGVKRLRYSFFGNRALSFYRIQNRIQNPNASAATKRKYLLEKKPVAGTRLRIRVANGAADAYVKCRVNGNMFELRGPNGQTYILDAGGDGPDARSMWMVFPGSDGKGHDNRISTDDLSIAT